jgi:branched-chain amino acid transport system substrate-binding protein
LQGKKLELIFKDTESVVDKAGQLAEKFINEDKYPIVLGGYSSSEGAKIIETVQKYGIPYLCSVPSADKITQQGLKSVFRLNPSSSQYITGLKDFLLTVVKPKTMAIVYEETDYGKSLSAVMRKVCEKEGINIVFDKSYAAKSTDYKPMLLEMKLKKPDAVFMVSYLMDAILLVKQSKELDIRPKIFTGGAAGFALSEFAKEAGEAAEYLVTADLWAPDVKYPGVKEFVEKFRAKFGEPTYHAVQAYASVYVLVDVLERAKSLNKEDLIAALKETNLMTPFGPVKFEDFENFTNQNKVPTLARQVKGGKLVTVWPKEIAVEGYVYPLPKK